MIPDARWRADDARARAPYSPPLLSHQLWTVPKRFCCIYRKYLWISSCALKRFLHATASHTSPVTRAARVRRLSSLLRRRLFADVDGLRRLLLLGGRRLPDPRRRNRFRR